MYTIRFLMMLQMVPNYEGLHFYLDLNFLKVEEPQNPFYEN